jgi:N,N'-diacetyllegionaminate synthase
MELKIGNRICSENNPLFIAEEGQANQGDLNLALKMIDLAFDSGADGIEFQLFYAKDMYILNHRGYQIYKEAELKKAEIIQLIKKTKEKKLVFQAACLSPELVDLCAEEGVDAFVINATDLNNPEMLDAVKSTRIPFWLATLMGTEEEIEWTVNYLSKKGSDNFGILHGQHVMSSNDFHGVPPQMSQLDCIRLLREKYNLLVGYVDHTSTIHMPAIAVAKGASIVMKHLAPEENWKGPDWEVALAPKDWKKSQELFRYSVLSSGSSKELSQAELGDRSIHRRGLYARHDLEKGQIVSKEDLIALRPGQGAMNPRMFNSLVGQKVNKAIKKHHKFAEDDVN